MRSGYPLDHECHVLPPAALWAEFMNNHDKAAEIIQSAKPLKESKGTRCKHVWEEKREYYGGPSFRVVGTYCVHCNKEKGA